MEHFRMINMKQISLILLLGFLLSGCQTMSLWDEPEAIQDPSNIENNTKKTLSDDADYLNIAKELYVAGQYKQAYQIASKLAEKGSPEAQYLLGYLVYYGQGVARDKEQGSKWIQMAADAGYRPAIEGHVMIKHGLTPDNKCETGYNKSLDK